MEQIGRRAPVRVSVSRAIAALASASMLAVGCSGAPGAPNDGGSLDAMLSTRDGASDVGGDHVAIDAPVVPEAGMPSDADVASDALNDAMASDVVANPDVAAARDAAPLGDGGAPAEFTRAFYESSRVAGFDAYQSWYGRQPLRVVGDYAGNTDWASITASSWIIGASSSWRAWVAVSPTTRRVNVGVTPWPSGVGGSLAQCASGAYDAQYRAMGSSYVAAGMGRTVFRFAWEEDGNWFAWTTQSQDARGAWSPDATLIANHRACFQHFSRAIHSTDPDAQVAWDVGVVATWNDQAYPGDDVVDRVSRDQYDESWVAGSYPFPAGCDLACMTARQAVAWNTNIGPLMVIAANFATQHHKPFDLGEWGVMRRNDGHGGLDDPDYVQHIYDLMHGSLPGMTAGFIPGYASYFEANADGGTTETRLRSTGTYATIFPRASSLYRTLFGN